jgi:putative DNA primase/helicase
MPAGGGIRLGQIENGKLLVSEGLETAISAGKMHGCAAWAIVNADRMRAWSPPQGIKHLIIAGDNDASYTGQFSAYCLANRAVCQFKIPKVEVCIPMIVDHDWNDVCNIS